MLEGGSGRLVPLLVLVSQLTAACATPTLTPPLPSVTAPAMSRIALVTDFGSCDQGQRWTSAQMRSWSPEAIITAGDNTQEAPCTPYTESVWDRLPPVPGPDGHQAVWPTLGNHDLTDPGAGLTAYRAAFPYLPTDADPLQRWYSRTVGGLNLFVLNSEASSEEIAQQRDWLSRVLPARRADHPDHWNVVLLHRPPYTSGHHEPNRTMRPSAGFDYRSWGADLVVSGHQHFYEDVIVDGLHYLTAGLGGSTNPRPCPTEREVGSRVCLEGTGVARIETTPRTLTLTYVQEGAAGPLVTDTISLQRP